MASEVGPVDSSLSAGAFKTNGYGPDSSNSGLQYQHYSVNTNATGWRLGKGARVAPSPDELFSHPISSAQFGGGGNARAPMGPEGEEE
jgi:hypothetical protein